MVPGFVSNIENYWDEPDLLSIFSCRNLPRPAPLRGSATAGCPMKTASVPWLERGPVEPKARTSGSRSATACECGTRGHGTETILIGPAEARHRTPGQRAFGRPKPRSSLPQSSFPIFTSACNILAVSLRINALQKLLAGQLLTRPYDLGYSSVLHPNRRQNVAREWRHRPLRRRHRQKV
jgi:hypothetical protein